MAIFKVDTASISETGSTYNASSEAIQSEITRLTSAAQTLVSSNWTGAAADSFKSYYDEWQSVAAKVRESLSGMSTALNSTSSDYESTENSLSSGWKG